MKITTKKQARFLLSSLAVFTASFSTSSLAAIPNGYYDTVNTSSPVALKSSLHEIIDDHQRFPYTSSSTDTWDILEQADQNPDDPGAVIDVYRNASFTKQGGGNTFYNREHSWPKSYGFPNDGSSNYAYTDAHHLFISDSGYNSSRSNKPYASCTSGCTEKTTEFNNNRGGGSGDSNWTAGSFSQGSWQTWPGRRGDVARALMYMAVRYEGGSHGTTGYAEPDLILTDDRNLIDQSNQGSNISVAYMGLKSTLLQWHKEDPVDEFEIRRNDAIYSHQGNRNPFIDHPEYVACVFEGNCTGGSDTTPPAAPTGLLASGGNGSVTLNWTANNEADLNGYNVYRSTSAGSGYSRVNTGTVSTSAYTDDSVLAGTTYFYVVSALDTSFNESTYSNEVTITTEQGSGTGDGTAWINEFHYDNSSTDVGEFVEIAGPAGLSLSGYSVVGYNGNGGGSYKTVNLSGVIPDQSNGHGVLSFSFSSMQNGGPDGLALVDGTGSVVEFLSYEGTFVATNGPANGMTSTDIGVAETSSTPAGYSLQLAGSGNGSADFTWQAASTATSGAINTGQSFTGTPVNQDPVAAFTANCTDLSCSFDASSSSDPDGSVVSYSWDFGDSSTGTGVTSSHNYGTDGDFTVTLTVTDDQGATNISSQTVTVTAPVVTGEAWINEFHYDNSGSDTNEFVEIAGTAGLNLSGWKVIGYNGNGGKTYKTVNLSGVIPNQQNGLGTLSFAFSGMQNGSRDALALVNNTGEVVLFISYEGTVTAVNGDANGMTSTDVGVSEPSSTPVGHSLQLGGTGNSYADFSWQAAKANTAGSINSGQSF